ncbi:MAG TPA: 1,2-phenylacetyl-CoA epoxidase subunit PaaD [Brumimicrobium sp.]|nr:1,2-phenylacetyl-CoA epoxidase subunit PaaD [Brumimicrobium sp.]
MKTTKEITTEYIWELLSEVPDPEVPAVSVVDLGVIHEVNELQNGSWDIKMTPTYTGCPATNFMALEIQSRLKKEGIHSKVDIVLSPSWTTDRISEEGKRKLKEFGITPPQEGGDVSSLFGKGPDIPCPRCESVNTRLISQFGSTACKAHYQCNDCHEPFDYFKCHK